jgi:hypothetical protein
MNRALQTMISLNLFLTIRSSAFAVILHQAPQNTSK